MYKHQEQYCTSCKKPYSDHISLEETCSKLEALKKESNALCIAIEEFMVTVTMNKKESEQEVKCEHCNDTKLVECYYCQGTGQNKKGYPCAYCDTERVLKCPHCYEAAPEQETKERCCDSCGKPFSEHLGLIGTCGKLQLTEKILKLIILARDCDNQNQMYEILHDAAELTEDYFESYGDK